MIPVLLAALFFGAWALFLQKLSQGRYWSHMWSAFSILALAGNFLVSGALGYELVGNQRIATGSPVWWEIWVGLVSIPIAFGFFWYARRRKTTNAVPVANTLKAGQTPSSPGDGSPPE